MKKAICLLLFYLQTLCLWSQTGQFYLLTCSPGQEVWNRFGHTAIRYVDPTHEIDWVYNYGLFSFNTPNFALRFMLGETDYLLGKELFSSFVASYKRQGRGIEQISLNLDEQQRRTLLINLENNAQPQNREYRYNFFFDNCATKPRDQIQKAAGGSVHYPSPEPQQMGSFREIVHRFTRQNHWSELGIDILLGAEADRMATQQESFFVPSYLHQAILEAQIPAQTAQGSKPLALGSETICKPQPMPGEGLGGILTPLRCALLLFVITLAASLRDWKRARLTWMLDLMYLLGLGGCGLLVAFMVFFSQHPCMRPNYLLLLFNPLHLLLAPAIIKSLRKPGSTLALTLDSLPVLALVLLWAFLPQQMPFALLFVSLSFLTRMLTALALARKTLRGSH